MMQVTKVHLLLALLPFSEQYSGLEEHLQKNDVAVRQGQNAATQEPHLRNDGRSFAGQERYACAICATLEELGEHLCEALHGCDLIKGGQCARACAAGQAASDVAQPALASLAGAVPAAASTTARSFTHSHSPRPASPVQLRVAKGLGSKPYGTLRVSAISTADHPAPFNASYSARFNYKWTRYTLHTSIISITPGEPTPFDGTTFSTHLTLPKQGEGAVGLLIADPCVTSDRIISRIACTYGEKFQTLTRTPALINAFMAGADTDYWGILGDNLYDQDGGLTAEFYAQFTLPTLSKAMVSVAGNHDYWVMGVPELGTVLDQFGNGHMQWYAQDTVAAKAQLAGFSGPPFDFSIDPGKGHVALGGRLPAVENSFFYNQIGNVGIIGFSGAYSISEQAPLLLQACDWLESQPTIEVALLVGHWDKAGMGASSNTSVPGMYDHVRRLPGCDGFASRRMLKFVMGHTHCNLPHPHGNAGLGFMVAGQGMSGCGNYGVPLLDTTGGRVRFWYFPVVTQEGIDSFAQVHGCVSAVGWRKCTHLAQLWLDEAIAK